MLEEIFLGSAQRLTSPIPSLIQRSRRLLKSAEDDAPRYALLLQSRVLNLVFRGDMSVAVNRLFAIGLCVVAAAATLTILVGWVCFISVYGTDVPHADQWSTPLQFLIRWADGNIEIADLWRQHNESRRFWPNVISIAVASVGGRYDPALELWIGYGLSCLNLGLMAYLFWRIDPTPRVWVFVFFATALYWSDRTRIFHMFSITFERLLAESGLLGAICLLTSASLSWGRIAAAILLGSVAQFSHAGGAVVWLLLVALVALLPSDSFQRLSKRAALAVVLGSGSASSVLYAWGYESPPHHSALTDFFVSSPIDVFIFVTRFVGNPVTPQSPVLVGTVAGVILLSLVYVHFQRPVRDRGGPIPIAWLVLGAYSWVEALVAAIGRLPMGLEHAMRADYVIHGVYTYCAIVALASLRLVPDRRSLSSTLMTLLLLAVSSYYLLTLFSPRTIRRFERTRAKDVAVRTCLLEHQNGSPLDVECVRSLFPSPDYLQRTLSDGLRTRVLDFR